MKKVLPGEKLEIPAPTYNAMIEAAKAEQARKTSATGGKSKYTPPDTDVILVQNDSGTDRERFDILGVDDVVITPTENAEEFKSRVALSCVAADPATHLGRFVVLLEPIADGKLGRASISGVCPCQIDVIAAGHKYADINPDSSDRYTLTSRQFGGAEILWKESGTGSKWAVLRIGSPKLFRRFELKTSLAIGGTATAHPLDWTGAAYAADTASDNEFTVYDSLGKFQGWARSAGVRDGARGLAMFHHDRGVWEIVAMQHIAQAINFTLTENMGYSTTGLASCSIDDYYDGVNPATVGVTLQVHDPQNLHQGAASGAKGKARWDDRSLQYHIVEMGHQNEFVQLTKSGSTSITSFSETAITGFSSLINSNTTLFDTSSPASGYDVKITRAGVYEFSYTVQVAVASDSSGDSLWWSSLALWIRDTSNALAASGIRHGIVSQCGSSDYRTVSATFLVEVDADESFRMAGKKLGGDNFNVYGAASPDEARWSIKYLGPEIP